MHLENWIVQDGEIPELHTGATLSDHAVRALCWSVQESQALEEVTELPAPDTSGDNAPHYQVTGTVEGDQEPSSALLRVGGFRVLAEPISMRQVPGTASEDFVLERFSPDFLVPAVGTRAVVVCRLAVMPAYETEAASDLRRDWVVRHLKIQHRALVPGPGREREWNVDKVLRVENIERMHRWADDRSGDHITYLLDLQLPT